MFGCIGSFTRINPRGREASFLEAQEIEELELDELRFVCLPGTNLTIKSNVVRNHYMHVLNKSTINYKNYNNNSNNSNKDSKKLSSILALFHVFRLCVYKQHMNKVFNS